LPPAAPEVIRYHPKCPFGPRNRAPCLLALARSIQGDERRGILRIALTSDGRKRYGENSKMALGPTGGAAVKLAPDEDLTYALGVAEGLEKALRMSLVPKFGATPAWALLGTGGVAKLPVLGGVDVLWIAKDNDPAGEAAASALASRWLAAGREVKRVYSTRGKDLNDADERIAS
jgi:hypothetical protein